MHSYWLEFSQVAVAHLLAVASPGPDFALVLKQSLTRGRAVAVRTSLGVACGILVHVTYSLLGLGLLIRGSATWFTAVKYAGALYLAWVGVQALRARPRPASDTTTDVTRASEGRAAFVAGFLTNALNPKATLFFLSLFVLVVDPATPKLVQAGYGLWMVVATGAWFCLVSLLFTRPDLRGRFLRFGHWIDRVLGLVFLAFAASLLFATGR